MVSLWCMLVIIMAIHACEVHYKVNVPAIIIILLLLAINLL